ncbi:MAG: energy transducer TonB [Deltaproteobacteria bacterium]|nr:energy transducer TonB [Deltaproteobacteria bacterium]
MKRMFPAAALAIIIHITILWLFDKLIIDNADIIVPISKTVTVTMSYRPLEKKSEKKPLPKINLKPKQPAIIPDKPDKTKPIQPEIKKTSANKKEIEPVKKNVGKIIEDITEEDPESSTHGKSISNITAPVEAVPLYSINPPPQYPRVAIKRGYQGTVELMVLVNESGKVADLWLFESSGYSILDQAALQSVKNWSFIPGRRGSQKIEMWVRVPVRFQLQ